ncbi:hypothetical protein FRC01_014001 [Tulasnella sp. 417]|nr:hypothetical protein FRC01_014001 [Tulasnella sp. 417]
MHAFWEIPELVSEIISLLPRADQVRMAQVNTTLWEIAIAHIWSKVPNIQYFFELFPADLWNKVRESSTLPPPLDRELRASDWTRFFTHSKHTTTIHYNSRTLQDAIPTEIWCHSVVATAFPRLERLVVKVFADPADPADQGPPNIIPSLLRPSLRRIELFADRCDADSPFFNILRGIAETKAPLLEELLFRLRGSVGSSNGVMEQAIASQRCLRRLEIISMFDIAYLIESAKDLPSLEELDVVGERVFLDHPERSHNNLGFRSLTTLTAFGDAANIYGLLRSIASNCLARVALAIASWTTSDTPLALTTELQRFRPHLVHLQIIFNKPFIWEEFEPVLNLAELQTFDLIHRYPNSPEITDVRVKQMVLAWPNLTQLRLQVESSPITLTPLAYIATHRSNLRKLAMNFDARSTMNSLNPPDLNNSLPNNALELFDVMASTFDEGDEERLANVFRSWWPKARLCRSDPGVLPPKRWVIDDASSWPW